MEQDAYIEEWLEYEYASANGHLMTADEFYAYEQMVMEGDPDAAYVRWLEDRGWEDTLEEELREQRGFYR